MQYHAIVLSSPPPPEEDAAGNERKETSITRKSHSKQPLKFAARVAVRNETNAYDKRTHSLSSRTQSRTSYQVVVRFVLCTAVCLNILSSAWYQLQAPSSIVPCIKKLGDAPCLRGTT